jgi:hypothetical protein
MVPGVLTRYYLEVEIYDDEGNLLVVAPAELNRAEPLTLAQQWWGTVGANLHPHMGKHLRLKTPEGTEGDFLVEGSGPGRADILGFGSPPL